MKNYFLLQRDFKREILIYVGLDQAGVGENEIVEHLLSKFGLYNSSNPYQALEWGNKIRAIAKKLAKEGKMQRYAVKADGDVFNWYLDHDAPMPEWLFVLEEGKDWTV